MKVVGKGPDLKIEEMFAFVAKDENGEGILGFMGPDGWMPLVGGDTDRIESLRPIARKMGAAAGKEVRLLRFKTRVDEGPA